MPSESVLAQKQQFVADLAEKLKNAAGGVLVDYKGITVEDDTKLRKELREAGIDYFVVKNKLLKRACEAAGIEGLDDVLVGGHHHRAEDPAQESREFGPQIQHQERLC